MNWEFRLERFYCSSLARVLQCRRIKALMYDKEWIKVRERFILTTLHSSFETWKFAFRKRWETTGIAKIASGMRKSTSTIHRCRNFAKWSSFRIVNCVLAMLPGLRIPFIPGKAPFIAIHHPLEVVADSHRCVPLPHGCTLKDGPIRAYVGHLRLSRRKCL